MAGCGAPCQAVWLETLLKELLVELGQPPKVLIDNKSALSLAKNPISHGRTKLIETRYHYARDQVNK